MNPPTWRQSEDIIADVTIHANPMGSVLAHTVWTFVRIYAADVQIAQVARCFCSRHFTVIIAICTVRYFSFITALWQNNINTLRTVFEPSDSSWVLQLDSVTAHESNSFTTFGSMIFLKHVSPGRVMGSTTLPRHWQVTTTQVHNTITVVNAPLRFLSFALVIDAAPW